MEPLTSVLRGDGAFLRPQHLSGRGVCMQVAPWRLATRCHSKADPPAGATHPYKKTLLGLAIATIKSGP